MAAKTNIKQLSFTDQMLLAAKIREEQLGVDFPEYVRYLIMRDIEDNVYNKENIYLTKDGEKGIEEAFKDVAKGKYKVVKNSEELKKYFEEI